MAKTKSTRARRAPAVKKKATSRTKPRSKAKPALKAAKKPAASSKARTTRAVSTATAGVWPGLPPGYFDRAR